MAEKDNYWDAARGVWVDRATGNYMKPVDAGGDGIWYSPDGKQRYVNGQWVPAPGGYGVNGNTAGGTTTGQATAGASNPTSTSSNGGGGSATNLQLNPGYQYDILERDHAFQADQTRINNDFNAKEAALNRDFKRQETETNNRLSIELQEGRIDAEKYMQAKELAQNESQFARSLALDTLKADRDFQLRSAEEARNERLLRAQLAAKPEDLVAYEYYKRGAGSPEAYNMAQQFAQAGGTATPGGTGTASTSGTGSGQFNPQPLSGQPYQPDNPAYSDATYQNLVSGFYNAGAQTPYNPRLSGTGAFGVKIEGPQSISRREGMSMSKDQMGVLTSFLNAGVDVGGGKRVSIDPNEYFQQVQDSWIPTLAGGTAGGMTQYR